MNGGVGISKNLLTSVLNEKRNKYLILMLNLKGSKQTRTEASKNKVISIKHINKLSTSKYYFIISWKLINGGGGGPNKLREGGGFGKKSKN